MAIVLWPPWHAVWLLEDAYDQCTKRSSLQAPRQDLQCVACRPTNGLTLCVCVCVFLSSADEEFDELCFDFGIELDEVVRCQLARSEGYRLLGVL